MESILAYFLLTSSLYFITGLLIFVIFSLIIYIYCGSYFNYFEYNDKLLVIRNSWRPFLVREILIEDIKKIEVSFIFFAGNSVNITLNNKIIGYPIGSISKDEIIKMAADILEKSDRTDL